MTTQTTEQQAQNAKDARTIVDKIKNECKGRSDQAKAERGNAHYIIKGLANAIESLGAASTEMDAWAIAEVSILDDERIVTEMERLIDISNWVAAAFGKKATDYYDVEFIQSVITQQQARS